MIQKIKLRCKELFNEPGNAIYAWAFVLVIIGFAPFFIFWPATINLDWDYFNAYSLLIRSEVLNYHVFPIHDPWMGGGLDLLTNGQNRIFSPLILINILLEPVLANIFSLLLYSFLGAWGCIKLAQLWKWKLSSTVSFVGLFSWSSWFSLHFSEGHIPFAGFQLIPCLQYLLITQSESFRKRCALGLLFYFLMAEGQVYPFVFLILYSIIWILLSSNKKEWIQKPLQWLVPIISISLIVVARAIPTLKNPIKRDLIFDSYSYSINNSLQAFFSPNQSVLIELSGGSLWRFHEYGCYLSALLTTLFFTSIYLVRKKQLPTITKTLILLALFWLWVGTGFGGVLNPWQMFQSIPVLNRLHIQSRTLILFFFPFLVSATFAWEAIRPKLKSRWTLFLTFVVMCEFLVVRFGTFYETLEQQGKPGPEGALIVSNTLEKTESVGEKFQFYLNKPNHSCALTYEPSAPPTQVKAFDQPGYLGEIHTKSKDSGVKIDSYTPGEIKISYHLKNPEVITMNTNFLQGWIATPDSGSGTVGHTEGGLLEWTPKETIGAATIKYRPPYLTQVFLLTLSGWILSLAASFINFERKTKIV